MAKKLVSWNVNGIRAVMRKDFPVSLQAMRPDVICVQETKAQDDQVHEALDEIGEYYVYPNSAERKGYAGTAILSREKPTNIQNDIGVHEHDQEGRVIAAEYDDHYLVTAYVPNSGRGLVRHAYRKKWDDAFRDYLKSLMGHKPVVLCGDLNVAHEPIDLARPRDNYNKTAGYTQLEIDGFRRHLDAGFTDTFRTLYPEKVAYSWWAYFRNARERNVGWRIDYFLVSEELIQSVIDSYMYADIMGSDHCPVAMKIGGMEE